MNDTEMDRMSDTSENITNSITNSLTPSPIKTDAKGCLNINNLGPIRLLGPMRILGQNESYDFSRISLIGENSGIIFNDMKPI